MKTEMATGATLKAVEGYDKGELKKAETVEKNPLPDQEGMLKCLRNVACCITINIYDHINSCHVNLCKYFRF